MNPNDWLELSRRAIEELHAQPPEQQPAWLVKIGILDKSGELSSSYGGPGRPTHGPNWMEVTFGPDVPATEASHAQQSQVRAGPEVIR